MIILREVPNKSARQGRHIARSRHLSAIGEARSIAELCAAHADLTRLFGHYLREFDLSTTERFSDHNCRIIGRFGNERQYILTRIVCRASDQADGGMPCARRETLSF